MARYINEDEFVEWVKEHWCADCQNDNGLRCRACWIDDAIDIVEEAPEADVVPRAELDAMRGAANSYKMHYEKAKTEIAEDLLSEIKKEAHNKAVHPCGCKIDPYISLRVLDGILQNYINKYTEEKK